MNEGGRLQHHEATSFSRCGQVNMCLGEWKQDLQVVTVVGNASARGKNS
jgi:hypothetical protein